MHGMKKMVVAGTILLVAASALAYSKRNGSLTLEDCSYEYTYTLYDDGSSNVVINSASPISHDVSIPSHIEGAPVTTIKGDNSGGAFANCTNMTSITIPGTIQSLGLKAFLNCTNLTAVHISDLAAWCQILCDCNSLGWVDDSNPLGFAQYLYLNGELVTDLVIPHGVTRIENAFSGYTNLTSLVIADTVKSLASKAFAGCSGLKRVDTGNGLTRLSNGEFACCTLLEDIRIGTNVAKISAESYYNCRGPFAECTSLKNITIPGNVTIISSCNHWQYGYNVLNNAAFLSCTSLTNVTLQSGVRNVDGGAFLGCTRLARVEIPNTVTNIGCCAFSSCEALTSVSLPNSVVNIGVGAFNYCKQLKSVVIPNSVVAIGISAFGGCPELREVTIPASVRTIGANAFHCLDFYSNASTPVSKVFIDDLASWCSIDFQTKDGYMDGPAHSGNPLSNGAELYVACVPVGKTLNIPDGVTNISQCAFYGWTNITSVTMADSVKNIGKWAFSACNGLKNVTIGDGVRKIDERAFMQCNGLESVIIGRNVVDIGALAFWCCGNLEKMVFKGDAPTVGGSAFVGVKSGCTAYVPWGSSGWNVSIPGTWNGINIAYLFSGKAEVAEADLPETIAVRPGADVTVTVDHDMLVAQLKALIAKFFAMPKGIGQDADCFKVTGCYDAVRGSVLVKAEIDTDKIGLDSTTAEVVGENALSSFKAYGTMRLANVKDGFYYGLAAAGRLEDMDAAVESAKSGGLVRAENGEVSVSAERPTGGSAFFKVIVSDNAQGEE